ncbi:MAG: hypothetical protein AB7Q04_13505 [Steroidobacteraceae bacterium]
MKHFFVFLTVVLMSACTLPQTTVQSGSSSPGLTVSGAPSGSLLFIDGLQVGLATEFNGRPKVLAVLDGVHQIEIRQGSAVIYSEKAFFSNGETHAVKVTSGAK